MEPQALRTWLEEEDDGADGVWLLLVYTRCADKPLGQTLTNKESLVHKILPSGPQLH